MPTTAAIVVTCNRRALFLECIEALLAQTEPVDHIFIVDNASTDGTAEAIAAKGYDQNPRITAVKLPRNMGGSGGFHEGMRLAYERNYDWLWIMDDDAEPEPDAYATLRKAYDGQQAVANMVYDADGAPQLGHRGNVLSIWQTPIVAPLTYEDLKKDFIDVEFASFVGVAYARSLVEKIGLPQRDFFIHYDDNEYNMRLAGRATIRVIPNSRIRHKQQQAELDSTDRVNFLGRSSVRIGYERLWLHYYGFRNLSWLRLRDNRLRIYLTLFSFFIKKIGGILVFDDHKIKRIRFWLSAFNDARNGVFDNDKPRKILYG